MTDRKSRSEFGRERSRDDNPFDAADGYSGQEYDRERQAAEAARDLDRGPDVTLGNAASPDDIPPENGRRATFDPATGEVHGSGSSTGGGNAGEDFDSDAAAGDGDTGAPTGSVSARQSAAAHPQDSVEPDRMPGDASEIHVEGVGSTTGPSG